MLNQHLKNVVGHKDKDSLTMASICSFSLREKMGEETGKGFEQILGGYD